MNFIFCKLKKPQKILISFFATLKNLTKHELHFAQALCANFSFKNGFNENEVLRVLDQHFILIQEKTTHIV